MPATEQPNQTNGEPPNDPPENQTDELTTDRTKAPTKVTVKQAARLLGLSAEAVRMRVKRGTLAHTKEGKTVYVLLSASSLVADQHEQTNELNVNLTSDQPNDQTEGEPQPLVEALSSEVDFLRGELRRREEDHREESRRKDSIIMALTQRVPELEPSPEAQVTPETLSEGKAKGQAPLGSQEPTQRRSWLYRFFFGQ
jgi:hypothetical protein